MARFVQLLLFAALVLASAGAGNLSFAQEQPDAKRNTLVELINQERVNAGLRPLARSAELDSAAQDHSVDMVDHNYLDHSGSDGTEPQERADKAGYHVPPHSGWIVVEVISAISGEPRGPVDWWLHESSGEHGKVLLNPRWREIGVGYAQGGEYGNYWTALFGCRPGVLPTVNFDGKAYALTEECGDPSVAPIVVATPTAQPTATPQSTPLATATIETLSLPTVKVNADIAERGGAVNVQWQGLRAATATDWIGLFRPSDVDTAYQSWVYVGCNQVPLDARPLGSCTVVLAPTLSPGAYEFRLFRANGYQRAAVSLPVRVE